MATKYRDVPGPMLALFLAMTTNPERQAEYQNKELALRELGIDPEDYDEMIAVMGDPEVQAALRVVQKALEKVGASRPRLLEVASTLTATRVDPRGQEPGAGKYADVPAGMLAFWLAATTNDERYKQVQDPVYAQKVLGMTAEQHELMRKTMAPGEAALQAARKLFLSFAQKDSGPWTEPCPAAIRVQQVATFLPKVSGE